MSAEEILPRLIRPTEVYSLLGMSRNQVDDMVKKGRFPAPIRLFHGGRAKAWLEHEIKAWLVERMANARTTDTAGSADDGED